MDFSHRFCEETMQQVHMGLPIRALLAGQHSIYVSQDVTFGNHSLSALGNEFDVK
jgi:hypothetical protein